MFLKQDKRMQVASHSGIYMVVIDNYLIQAHFSGYSDWISD